MATKKKNSKKKSVSKKKVAAKKAVVKSKITNNSSRLEYFNKALNYANGVLKGSTPACKYVKAACSRFLKDLKRKEFYIDYDKVHEWCSKLEKLPHIKGKWAASGETLLLSPYQIFCTVNIFGFYITSTGRRRFREVYIEVPRKNGKTFWIAGIGIGMLTWEREQGAEVYCGATSEKQALEVFVPAKKICEKLPKLRQIYGVEVNAKSITILSNSSKFEPVIGNPGDGASPSCGIADEFHEHKNSDLVDTFVTGMGARTNPLQINITTAGYDMGGPCYEKRSDVIKILDGVVQDDSIFGIIYTIDEDDQWDTVEAQIKANPNYGISVDTDFLAAQLLQAKRSATRQVAYKTKHLNLWVGAKSAWLNMLAYQVCRKDIKIEDYYGNRAIIGIDLASRSDFACMAILILLNGEYKAFLKHYLPEETILNNDRYKAWHNAGWIESTPGNTIDFEYIEDDLKDLRSKFEIVDVAYDPFQATQFSIRMAEEGFPMVEIGATVRNFSDPMKELEAKILRKEIEFTNDPVLTWMFGNVVAKLDKKDNIFPDKEAVNNKIDGVVALIMTINRLQNMDNTGSFDEFLKNPVVIR